MLGLPQALPPHLHGVYDGLSCGPGQGASHEALLNVQRFLLPPDGPLDLRMEHGSGVRIGTLEITELFMHSTVLQLAQSWPVGGVVQAKALEPLRLISASQD